MNWKELFFPRGPNYLSTNIRQEDVERIIAEAMQGRVELTCHECRWLREQDGLICLKSAIIVRNNLDPLVSIKYSKVEDENICPDFCPLRLVPVREKKEGGK